MPTYKCKCVYVYTQPLNTPFNLPFHKPGVEGLRNDKPDAFFLKLLRDNERFKTTVFLTVGSRTDGSKSSISNLARLYRIARLVLFVAHHTMRVK